MSSPAPPADPSRRRVLEVTLFAGAVGVVAVLGAPIASAILAPVRTRTVQEPDGFVEVAKLAELPKGRPVRVTVKADRTDAWVTFRDVELGGAWLTRRADDTVQALSTICPHLGCAVDHAPDKGEFACPCHESGFAPDGAVRTGPSPRPLDTLETRLVEGRVLLRFERFVVGGAKKRRA